MNDNIRVALVSPEFPPSLLGGIGAVCHDLALSLSKSGVSTTVFCGKSDRISHEKANGYLSIVRMPILNLPPRHLWFQAQNIVPLLRLLKEFDVIHVVDPRIVIPANFKKSIRKPLITHIHGCGHCEAKLFLKSPIGYWSSGDFVFTVLEYPMNEYLTRLSLRNSDHVVVCSTNRYGEMTRRNSDLDFSKISVIFNGIDFSRLQCETSVIEENESLLFWGRLYYNKGIIQLIRALSLVKQDFPKVILDICGKGPLEAKIRALTSKLGLESNVRVHGYVNTKDLTEKIRKASVVVLPSLYEGQPMAALEAMAFKKPVVMYEFPFAREYVTDWHNGLMAKGGDIEDLANRICAALSDRKLRANIGQNAYQRVKKNHNWDVLVNKYIELYRSLSN